MSFSGGCYCGKIKYEAEGEALMKVQCHCRECTYITGGSANLTMGVAEAGFKYTQGAPSSYKRDDIDGAVTRDFCGDCGTPLVTRLIPGAPGAVLLKIGSLDNPADFIGPDAAIYTDEKHDFHTIADGVAQFTKLPE
ncbi:MAG TPA: hypothetical protein DCS39_06390 [Rhodobiaceae bacterium]|nr:hypothetical protein [Rhodobiaceae bacterium]